LAGLGDDCDRLPGAGLESPVDAIGFGLDLVDEVVVAFDRDFVMSVIIHVVLPIIALLGVQFPEALRQAFSWVGAIQGGH
jgi:hypothetical protein